MSIRSLTLTPMLLVVAASLVACGGGSSDPSPVATATSWLIDDAPSDARNVAEVKKTAREGDEVVVRGRIGGRRDPINYETAVFLMMDPLMKACRPEEGCPTPWDYCCVAAQAKAENNATVQVVDESGVPLELNVEEHGLIPLAEIIVVGTVGPRAGDAVLVIKAKKVHVVKG